MSDRSIYRLCLVTDRGLSRGRSSAEIAAAAVRGGATMVQLREKNCSTRDFLAEAQALKALLGPLGVPLIVNDRVDIALAIAADGVHVGQKDMPVAEVRKLVGPKMIIGLSITNREQIEREDARLADYLGIGPLYAQTTKSDAATPLGVAGFARLRAMTQKPVLAIGGLKADKSAAVLAAGADGLAVVSAVVAADDPEAAARELAKLTRR
jgi:thiamine-phosphate pyrophosphorylase